MNEFIPLLVVRYHRNFDGGHAWSSENIVGWSADHGDVVVRYEQWKHADGEVTSDDAGVRTDEAAARWFLSVRHGSRKHYTFEEVAAPSMQVIQRLVVEHLLVTEL